MKLPRIAIILRTNGLEYDDRVRKECISLSKIADINLFVTFENNREEEGITSYGIPYKSYSLKTREKFSSGRFLFIKALEFYFLVKKHLNDYDLIWAHEEYTFLFCLLSRRNKFIWDLHEIPVLLNRPILKQLFNYIEVKSKKIIHANPFRKQYLIDKKFIKYPHKHDYIRNFPDSTFVNSLQEAENYDDFRKWLEGDAYVYLQGISTPDRYPYNCIASILKATGYKIVVVGSFNDRNIINQLETEFGETYSRRVFVTGMINQLATPAFLSGALFSVVFYQTNTPNERYCEANRFYQSLLLGVPVITGVNEPMSEIIREFDCGVSIKSDGINLDEVIEAIEELLGKYEYYKANAKRCGSHFLWKDDLIKKEWVIS